MSIYTGAVARDSEVDSKLKFMEKKEEPLLDDDDDDDEDFLPEGNKYEYE